MRKHRAFRRDVKQRWPCARKAADVHHETSSTRCARRKEATQLPCKFLPNVHHDNAHFAGENCTTADIFPCSRDSKRLANIHAVSCVLRGYPDYAGAAGAVI